MKINNTWRKVIVMYGASFLSIPLNVLVSILNTSLLGPKLFGDFKFIETVARFIASLTSVGLFISISRLVAINSDDTKEKKFIGLFVYILGGISIVGMIIFLIFSWLEPYFFENALGPVIRNCLFIVMAISAQLAILLLLKGLHRIYEMAFLSILPASIYLLIIYGIKNYVDINVTLLLSIYYSCLLLVIVFQLIRLKPILEFSRSLYKELLLENKTNGKPVYIGSLAGVATTHIAGLSISFFMDNTQVGFYMLALTICNPILVIPSVLGNTFFKQFANMSKIPGKVFAFSLLVSLLALVAFYLLIDWVVIFFYGESFAPVTGMASWLIIGFIFHGLGDLINRFLGAKGEGVTLRNAAFFVGIVNVLGYVLLVKYFLVTGAIVTKILASCLYFLLMLGYYTNFIKKHKNVQE
ncbi:lipopolysaccharide biosynthesis protein [Flagellimonas beolgyonensis]|uniref:lipopolysaccharide biosynthesis protein n=1 Tax=Flagellimonas beolgyonensis TaxID=864064 RepID=UPI000F8C6B7B|nr:oligosaccharide flippase family protein [Allomuricauda beolgyonensis]